MTKQQIHAYVESTIYLELKMKKVNMSALVNKLIKEYLSITDEESKELIELQTMMEKAKRERTEKDEEMHLLAIRIAKSVEDREREMKQKDQVQDDIIESIKRSGELHG